MINSLVPKKKDNIFKKVKNFFCGLFKKGKNKIDHSVEELSYERMTSTSDDAFKEEIKVEVSNDFPKMDSKDEFIKKLENDMTLLEHLSIDRLEALNKYYDKLIEQDQIELKKLNYNN